MSIAENYVTPRSDEETDTLLGQRYGVAPTPGCQLQPPDIHGWTPTPPKIEAPKPIPSVAVGECAPFVSARSAAHAPASKKRPHAPSTTSSSPCIQPQPRCADTDFVVARQCSGEQA